MKKINRNLIKGTNWALAGLLTVLGFNGCDLLTTTDEYGSPHADYTVKGKVVNKSNGRAIKGIKAGFTSPIVPEYGVPSTPYQQYLNGSVTTGEDGSYKITTNDDELLSYNSTSVTFSDIDGDANGAFADTTVVVDFAKAEQTKKRDGWYSGEFTINLDIELREKTQDE